MLSLLCSNPRPDDYDFEVAAVKPPRRRLSLSSSKPRPPTKRVTKLSISGPTDFVHTSHVGHDQLDSGLWHDSSRWQQPPPPPPPPVPTQPVMHFRAPPTRPTSQPVISDVLPPVPPIVPPARRASLPLSHHSMGSPPSPTGPTQPVRRKPPPAFLNETASVSPFPSAIVRQTGYESAPRAAYQHHHQPQGVPVASPARERQLVRLLDALPEGRDSANPILVTHTAKARFDGAMREIAQALREPPSSAR